YIVREDEEEDIERRKKERLRAKRNRQAAYAEERKDGDVPKRAQRSRPERPEKGQRKARKEQRVR
ncbi:MAG: FtsW/RodA/SpoVE family cell cycle protein, partial [Dorea sp.]|nr:FtsW/RodA/SpoVE family cell cycle protein [Dorea sp.]